jgi:hypothetical protein
LTRRLPAEVLVTDAWIGRDGIRAAAEEFKLGGYEYIVVTGEMNEERRNQPDDVVWFTQRFLVRQRRSVSSRLFHPTT